jgi:hypothetical protein
MRVIECGRQTGVGGLDSRQPRRLGAGDLIGDFIGRRGHPKNQNDRNYR